MCSQLYLELLLVSILLLIYHGTTNAAYHNQHKRITKRKSHDFFSGSSHLETLSWAVKLSFDPELYTKQELDMVADLVALETSLDNLGQIGEFKGHYFFIHKFHKDTTKHITNSYQENYWNDTATDSPEYEDSSESMTGDSQEWRRNLTEAEWWRVKEQIHDQLDGHHYVQWHMQQLVRSRQKRFYEFNDPMFPKQWHLVNRENPGYDINVTGVWQWGYTGKGVTTAVIDDGLEWTNPDLRSNYSPEGSWDLNSNDADPMPHGEKEKNHHGTRCAGEIAAVADNSICGVGVAYGARVAGIRVLDGPMTDSLEATAFMKGYTVNDVYSCSWGPDDDGKTVDGPHYLAMRAMRLGVDYGRKGYGAIYVVASGNGGQKGDNCNFDGYANSIYTLTIGAVDEVGAMPFYAEECASMLAVTYSSGSGLYQRNIVTTDWMKDGGTGCTDRHTGTSAAAPIAAGIIALMMEARPCLTWRDVQHLVVMTADKVDVDLAHWSTNKAGLHHSHKHGFGLMNAWALVNAAKAWESVPWMTLFTSDELEVNQPIPPNKQALELNFSATMEELDGYQLNSLEYVQAIVTIDHDRRGDLEIQLRCPSGTVSMLGARRHLDELVQSARDGHYIRDNITIPCRPPPLRNKMVNGLSERILKVLTLCSAFCAIMGVYQSLEYAFCYDDEKRSQYKLIALIKRAQRLAEFENSAGTPDHDGENEHSRLLSGETIAMAELSSEARDMLLAQAQSDSVFTDGEPSVSELNPTAGTSSDHRSSNGLRQSASSCPKLTLAQSPNNSLPPRSPPPSLPRSPVSRTSKYHRLISDNDAASPGTSESSSSSRKK